jgi:hypothetical protein
MMPGSPATHHALVDANRDRLHQGFRCFEYFRLWEANRDGGTAGMGVGPSALTGEDCRDSIARLCAALSSSLVEPASEPIAAGRANVRGGNISADVVGTGPLHLPAGSPDIEIFAAARAY